MRRIKVDIKNTRVSLKGMTEEVFDAVIAVAKASWSDTEFVDELVRSESDDYLYFGQNFNDCKEVSVEEFLFSLAPDWAVDIRVIYNEFYYTDQWKKCVSLQDKSSRVVDDMTRFKLIATREPKPKQWQPKVGEPCLHHGDIVIPRLTKPDSDGAIIVEYNKEYIFVTPEELKPLPPEPTEEEKLVGELSSKLSEILHITYTEEAAKELIKAGYRKVEPINKLLMINDLKTTIIDSYPHLECSVVTTVVISVLESLYLNNVINMKE